jgi:HPt (histidine-containing phosphotransfer) domain-containing protein
MFSLPPEMISTYLQRRFTDIELLRKGLETNSVEAFHRIGHQVMGNARSYGFDNLEPIANRMESLDSSELQVLGPQLIEEFTTCLENNLKSIQ